ncbi:MFS transporter [Thermodesulfobacteriota bacterium]
MKATLLRPGPLLLAASFGLYTLQWLALMGFLPTFLIEKLGMDQGRAAVLTAVSVAVNVIGNLMGGWFLHRNVPRWILLVLASTAMSISTLGIYSDAIPDLLRYFFCIGFSLIGGMIPASAFAGVPVHAPSAEMVGTTNGLIMQGANLGQVLGPPVLAAVVSTTGGWQHAPWLFLTCGLSGVFISLGIRALESNKSPQIF